MNRSDWIAGLKVTLSYSVGLVVGFIVWSNLGMLNPEDLPIPSYLLSILMVFVLTIVERKF